MTDELLNGIVTAIEKLVKTNKEQQEVLDLLTKKVLDHEQRLVGRSTAPSGEPEG